MATPAYSANELEFLRGLRAQYLERSEDGEPAPLDGSWVSVRELELYDQTFGARIGMKWRAVLDELVRLRVEPPGGLVLDWGTGSGVAARAWIARFGAEGVRVALWDNSPLARAFAARALRTRWPELVVEELAHEPSAAPDVLLVSHALGELDDAAQGRLVELARASRFVCWVEPGSRAVARRLAAVRDALAADLVPLAPCPHARACPTLAPGAERSWCHHHAPSDPEVFTTARWAEFARALGIDLRSLPYSFVALGRGPEPERPQDLARVLGRPRLEKGKAELELCTQSGLRPARLLERTDRALVRSLASPPRVPLSWRVALREGRVESVAHWEPAARWRASNPG